MTSSARAYLQLARPANVATALADVLAGFAISGHDELQVLPALLVATSCLYAGGVVLNDVFDRAIDAVERPERPIPSGRVSARRAGMFGAGLLVAGVAAAALVGPLAAGVAAILAIAAVLYDAWSKHNGVIGPVNMGVCRGLNLVLGMTAAPMAAAVHWPIALISVAYIAAVTLTSRGEVFGGRRTSAALAVAMLAGVCAALLGLALWARQPSVAAVAATVALGWRVLPRFWRAWRIATPDVIRDAVRTGVLSLVLVDTAIGAAYAGMIYALVILAVALVAGRLARVFAVT